MHHFIRPPRILLVIQLYCLFALVYLSFESRCTAKVIPRLLAFNSQQTFKILQFADLHFGESQDKDEDTTKAMSTILREESPVNLVVMTGDMVSGFAWKSTGGGDGWFQERWQQLTAPLRHARVSYAIALGNHDSEANFNRTQILHYDMKTGQPLSHTRASPSRITPGSNYWLDIYHSRQSARRMGSRRQQSLTRLWILDSMKKGCMGEEKSWGCVPNDVVEWVGQESKVLPRSSGAVAFVHIPVPQFMAAWNQGKSSGSKFESVSCPREDSGLFGMLKSVGVTAIYSGHDHLNNYHSQFEGVRLAYGMKTGYGAYGPPSGYVPGARVILLQQGQEPSQSATWIRFGNGSRMEYSKPTSHKCILPLFCQSTCAL